MKSKQEIINAKLDAIFALMYQQSLASTNDVMDIQDVEDRYIQYNILKQEWQKFGSEYGD